MSVNIERNKFKNMNIVWFIKLIERVIKYEYPKTAYYLSYTLTGVGTGVIIIMNTS